MSIEFSLFSSWMVHAWSTCALKYQKFCFFVLLAIATLLSMASFISSVSSYFFGARVDL